MCGIRPQGSDDVGPRKQKSLHLGYRLKRPGCGIIEGILGSPGHHHTRGRRNVSLRGRPDRQLDPLVVASLCALKDFRVTGPACREDEANTRDEQR